MKQKTALISVYYKDGIDVFASQLMEMGWRILASGGTYKYLTEKGVSAEDIADIVGGGPILGHRVVTLSREVYASILATDGPEDLEELERLGLNPIDMVVVDLYPLEETINEVESDPTLKDQPLKRLELISEKTDIGGPTLLRAAAKGGRIVLCRENQRKITLSFLASGSVETELILLQRAEAEKYVGDYCIASAKAIASILDELVTQKETLAASR